MHLRLKLDSSHLIQYNKTGAQVQLEIQIYFEMDILVPQFLCSA